jgi:hypothetical protein
MPIGQDYLDFLRLKPNLQFVYVNPKGGEDIKERWTFFPTGIFGHGYYKLTKNGRRHPKGSFKTSMQIYRELKAGKCEEIKQ